MNRLKYFSIILAVSAFIVFSFLFINNANSSVAKKHEFWITIDKKELVTIQKSSPELNLKLKSVQNGIAVVNAINGDLEKLSNEMHKHFHKCSGFTAHETESEAISAITNTFTRNSNEKLVDYTIDNQENVNQLLPETQENKIRQTILDLSAFVTRRHDQPTGQESANFIKDKWTTLSMGRNDITVEFINHPANVTPQPSIILTIQGTVSPDEIVVIGGHQDSIISGSPTGISPGADDNASGIASITEAIRIIVEKGFRPEKTVKFMAYAAEEVGLRGSNDIATNFSDNNINVIGVVQFDMTNFQGSPNIDFAFESDTRFVNAAQTQFLKDLVQTYLPTMQTADFQCGYACSDHASWQRKGFPASFPFEASFGQHNNQIHSPNDTISRSNDMATHAEKFTKLALTYLGELAKGSTQTNAPQDKARFDFDGDNKTDISIFRPDVGQWWYLRSSDNQNRALQFGNSNDTPATADFTGDGKTDITFWRESTGEWFIIRSEDDSFFSFPFGSDGDIPAPADFDGDGKDDPAVYRPGSGIWYILKSTGGIDIIPFGISEDKPVVADYDGDGKADIAIYRPTVSEWWINRSQEGVVAYQFGSNGDKTVQGGDYTGDGKADLALWRKTTGEWLILRSEDTSFFAFPFGSNGDIPTPGDYDGDGKMDAVVFRPSINTWFRQQTVNGFDTISFGATNDVPLPNSFVFE